MLKDVVEGAWRLVAPDRFVRERQAMLEKIKTSG
jgi:hypothetical protein